MSAENLSGSYLIFAAPIFITSILTLVLIIANGNGTSALAYACGFAHGQSATIYQIDPSKTAESETPICAKFRETALARGFTPANWTVNYGH